MLLKEFIDIVSPFSITSAERIECLYVALSNVVKFNKPGAIVECGVYKAGNILGVMEFLFRSKDTSRTIWLYDTFSGMTPPEEVDIDFNNNPASKVMGEKSLHFSLEEVKQVLSNSSYPKDKLKFVVGPVEQTLMKEENIPDKIALLRLDTDWYSSTKKELEVLYPKLITKGALIIDDYGHWKGARKATDEYFEKLGGFPSKYSIDYTGILITKGGDTNGL